jgi:hypothetical protein
MTARLLALVVAVQAGCLHLPEAAKAAHGTRPVGEDLFALLPDGADLVLDFDVEQLRYWPPARRILDLLPPAASARLAGLGFDPIDDIDALAVAVRDLGAESQSACLVVRGKLELARLVAAVAGPDGQATPYHGSPLAEGGDRAVARLAPKVFAFGARADVRRMIDLAHGEGESVRRRDRDLMEAFSHAPTAKIGRPALMAALVPTERLRERLREADLPGGSLTWIALSFAVGDGFDVGVIAGTGSDFKAREVVEEGLRAVERFRGKKGVIILGLAPLLDPIVLVARGVEVHLAYRVPAPLLARGLERLEALARAAAPTGDKR